MHFNDKQKWAIEQAIAAVKHGSQFFIGGYAGTGKTTIVKAITDSLSDKQPILCSFMGKAAGVLARKTGLDATTVHQKIYRYDEDTRRFYKRKNVDGDYFIIDEGQTIPTKLWYDIQSYKLPIIVLGDPGQLEPVGEDAKLMQYPDIILDEIFRYDDEIARFAEHVRLEGEYPEKQFNGVEIHREKSSGVAKFEGTWLCGFNKTRVGINKTFRKNKHINSGDKLVVLQNNWEFGVTNGMIVEVLNVLDGHGQLIAATCLLDNGKTKDLLLWEGNLHQEKTISYENFKKQRLPDSTILVDFGYCLTVHKFIGSQDTVVNVIDEQCSYWTPARWRYTAVTRAEQLVRVFV